MFACICGSMGWGRVAVAAYNDGVICVRVTEYGSMPALEHAENNLGHELRLCTCPLWPTATEHGAR